MFLTVLIRRYPQQISKKTRTLLSRIAMGEQDHYVIIRDNRPIAIIFSTDEYESLMTELEDLRIEVVARDRLATLDHTQTISHADMLARIGVESDGVDD